MPASPYTLDEYVRWSDVDFAGIICYGAYLRFFELGETELFREAGVPYGVMFERFDLWLPRARVHVEFRHPARLDDRLRVATYFSKIGSSSITINFDVANLDAQRVAAEAHQVLVCVDRQSLRPKPIPDDLRTILMPYRLSRDTALAKLGHSST